MSAPRMTVDALPRDRLIAEMSVWSADLGRIADDVARLDPFTDVYHLDAADGHFSPAFLLFPDLVAAVRKSTAKPLHVHLMVEDTILLEQIRQFADVGADIVSVHVEKSNIRQKRLEAEEPRAGSFRPQNPSKEFSGGNGGNV